MKIIKLFGGGLFGLFLAVSACQASTLAAPGVIDNGLAVNPNTGITAVEPVASPVFGVYNSSQSVTLTASGATSIRYTTDGSSPSCSTGSTYAGAIIVSSNTTIKAIACYSDNGSLSPSNIASFAYAFQCAISSVANGNVTAYPGCAIICNSGYSLSNNTCQAISGGSGGGGGGGGSSYSTCPITSITNGTVAAYPTCTVTCNTGYTFINNACQVVSVIATSATKQVVSKVNTNNATTTQGSNSNSIVLIPKQPVKEVLGVKTYNYANNSLLKTAKGKLYLLQNNKLVAITKASDLAKYRNKKFISISEDVVSYYENLNKVVLGVKKYPVNSLLRGSDLKLYLITTNGRRLIAKKDEKKYSVKKIINVADSVLKQYKIVK